VLILRSFLKVRVPAAMRHRLTCKHCEQPFYSRNAATRYCSLACAEHYAGDDCEGKKWRAQKAHNRRLERLESLTRLALGSDLRMTTEAEFEDWFRSHYWLFGIHNVISVTRDFPDVLAELPDGSLLRVELEYHASNFARHKHDPNGADVIFAYASCGDFVAGVPVLALYRLPHADDRRRSRSETLRPTPFFLTIQRSVKYSALDYLTVLAAPKSDRQPDPTTSTFASQESP
jgi:hypothetical protein